MQTKVIYSRLFMLQMFYYHYEEFMFDIKTACEQYFIDDIQFEITKRVAIEHFLEYRFSIEQTKQMLEQLILKSSEEELGMNIREWQKYENRLEENKEFKTYKKTSKN